MNKVNVRFETEAHFKTWKMAVADLLIGDITKDTKVYNMKHGAIVETRQTLKIYKPGAYDERMEHWKEMPHYTADNVSAFAHIIFQYTDDEVAELEAIVGQQITELTKSIYVPKMPNHRPFTYKRIIGRDQPKNKYPIYIVSKNRPNDCTTSFHLSLCEVDHYIVIEPQQLEMYQQSTMIDFDHATLLCMDLQYQEDYDKFDDLGLTKSTGPGPARNFAWDHSIENGFAWHWVFDDNATGGFYRFENNERIKIRSGGFFRALEDWVDRYDNIAQAGLNYRMFIAQDSKYPPYTMNTRIYSFLLIRNDVPFRWRGRYNEDTDLSLRMLKAGWCTVQFNNFLADKAKTQTVQGGNTEEFYAHEGTHPKSDMLVKMHPDVARAQYRFGRDHHYVDYTGYKQCLKFKEGLSLDSFTDKVNEYGMVTVMTEETVGNRANEKKLSELNELYLDKPELVHANPSIQKYHTFAKLSFDDEPKTMSLEDMFG